MPHIIIEYSQSLGDILDVPKLVVDMHDTLAAQGIDKGRIKTCAMPCVAAVGDLGLDGHMIHTTLLLLEGRDVPTKRQYGDALQETVSSFVKDKLQHCAVTLEVRDMVKDTYYL